MPTILIVDDHPLFREAISDVLLRLFAERGEPLDLVDAADSKELLRIMDEGTDFDLVLLDLSLPGALGLSELVTLRSRMPATPVAIVSSVTDSETMRQALVCGAVGFIPKSSSRAMIATALQTLFAGGIYVPPELIDVEQPSAGVWKSSGKPETDEPLTARQIDVLALLAEGKSNKVIARTLRITDTTVKVHVTAILRKLKVSSRAQAIVAFQRKRQS